MTKAEIYNLALGALLLQRQIANPDTDASNEAKVLNTHYTVAFNSTLEDLDLDATMSIATLELIETNPNELWSYAYKYPTDCVFLRRLQDANNKTHKDNRYTHHPKNVQIHDGQKAIMTNLEDATAEYISTSVPLTTLSQMAGLAIAYRLAILSAPLIVGKGATALRKELRQQYVIYKAEAQEKDKRENFNYYDDAVESDWVNERLS